MKSRTETLEVGSHAPDFSLSAANRDGVFTLGGLLGQGLHDQGLAEHRLHEQRPLILEFLRGTW